MTVPPLRLRWSRQEPPLPPVAVAGCGECAGRLRAAVRDRVASGAQLRAAADVDCVVALGDAGDLPWVDGATYLGWDAGLLVPTTLVPWPPAQLIRESLAIGPGAVVVLLPDRVLVSPMPVRSADPAALGGGAGWP